MIPSAEHWRIREDREFYLDGLRLAVGVDRDKSQVIEGDRGREVRSVAVNIGAQAAGLDGLGCERQAARILAQQTGE